MPFELTPDDDASLIAAAQIGVCPIEALPDEADAIRDSLDCFEAAMTELKRRRADFDARNAARGEPGTFAMLTTSVKFVCATCQRPLETFRAETGDVDQIVPCTSCTAKMR